MLTVYRWWLGFFGILALAAQAGQPVYSPAEKLLLVPAVRVGPADYRLARLRRLGGGPQWQFLLETLEPYQVEPRTIGADYDPATRIAVLEEVAVPSAVGEKDIYRVEMQRLPTLSGTRLLVTRAWRENGEPAYALMGEGDGALWLPDGASYDALAVTSANAGLVGVKEVKFVMLDVNTPHPVLYFQNSHRYLWHFDFVSGALGLYAGQPGKQAEAAFSAVTYFSGRRRNLAGSIVYYPDADLYALEFWPTDPVPAGRIIQAWRLIHEAMPFARDRLVYHPVGETHEALYDQNQAELAQAGVVTVLSSQLSGHTRQAVLNPGESYGRLRVIGPGDSPPTVRDVAIFTFIPNNLGRVAGLITETPQTTLSHINLRAKQDNRPNVYIDGASQREDIAPLIGKWVHLRATGEGIVLEEVFQAEAQAWLESVRPDRPLTPASDLTVTEPTPLSQIGFSDWTAFGVKAANVAELGKILPEGVAPDGYALPFALYDRFMSLPRCGEEQTRLCAPGESGLSFYDQARALLADAGFQNDPEVRSKSLKALRKRIKKGEAPEDLTAAVEAVRRFWEPQGPPFRQSLRCRSSTNNEDLPGFNGAGLYRSTTHKADEGALIESVKKVWASLWNDEAFEERAFWRVDHFQTYMGVLIHPNYGDEQANGVAVSKNLYNPDWPGYTVNAQHGEISVTNPEPVEIGNETVYPVPDEFVLVRLPVSSQATDWETIFLRHSNITEVYGQAVTDGPVLTPEETDELRHYLTLIHHHFKKRYRGGDDFAIEVEFKITETDDGSRGRLAIKQARTWVE